MHLTKHEKEKNQMSFIGTIPDLILSGDNDGLIFVSYDHSQTFYEIIKWGE